MKVDMYGTEVEIFFNEYDSKTKKRKVIDMEFTSAHRRELDNQMDSTDSGCFFNVTVGTKTITGHFSF